MSKSDVYGFSAAAQSGLQLFEIASRQSGRTARLIERVGQYDQIIVPNSQMADEIRRRLRLAGKQTVKVIMVPPNTNPLAHVGTAPLGRTFFEHEWIRCRIAQAIAGAADDIDAMQAAMSKTWPKAPDPSDSQNAELVGRFAREEIHHG